MRADAIGLSRRDVRFSSGPGCNAAVLPVAPIALLMLSLMARSVFAAAVPATLEQLDSFSVPNELRGFPLGAAVSTDGRHVYVSSGMNDPYVYPGTLGVLERTTPHGALRFASAVQTPFALPMHYTLLGPVVASVVSPDDANVYAVAQQGIASFSRDSSSGSLVLIDTDAAAGVWQMAMSPDGLHLYVSAPWNNELVVLARDVADGSLSVVQHVPTVDLSAFLTVSPDGRHVYVANSLSYYWRTSAIAVFERDLVSGALTGVQEVTEFDPGLAELQGDLLPSVSPDGAHVYVSSPQLGVVIFSRNPLDGTLALAEIVRGSDEPAVDGAGSLVVSNDGAHAYVAARTGLAHLTRNAVTGALTAVEIVPPWLVTGDLESNTQIVLSPDGANVYATDERGYFWAVFEIDSGTGAPTLVHEVAPGDSAIELAGATGIALSPDDAHVYVASDEDDAVVALAREPLTGSLSYIGSLAEPFGFDGLDGAMAVRVSPDGANVYVAGRDAGAIITLTRDETTGALTYLQSTYDGPGVGLSGVADVEVSPDGKNVYVAAATRGEVTAFTRAMSAGTLTVLQTATDGTGGIDDLAGAAGVAVSPDGAHVYVTAADDDALLVFARNASTGVLSLVDTVTNGETAAVSLDGPTGLALSPDGASVYVVSPTTRALGVFERDAATGRLTLLEEHVDGIASVEMNPQSVVVGPDGTHVFLADYEGVDVFSRDPPHGRLAFVEFFAAGYPFRFGRGVAASADGSHIFLAGGQGVGVFTRGFSGCGDVPAVGCRVPAAAGAGLLKVVAGRQASGRRLTWKWRARGEATALVDFATPTARNRTHYALCVWDESSPSPTLIARALVPSGPRWDATPNRFLFSDRDARVPEGMRRVSLKVSRPGGAVLVASAVGVHLPLSALPLGVPLRSQLQAASGECWEAVFSAAGVMTSDANRFVGVSD